MLALAQAVMPEPRLLLVDELSLGLAPVVVMELLEVVRRLQHEGVAVVLVEQSAELALQVADRAVFLEKGETRFSGPARWVFLPAARDQVEAAANGEAGDKTFRTFDIATLVHAGKTRATLTAR